MSLRFGSLSLIAGFPSGFVRHPSALGSGSIFSVPRLEPPCRSCQQFGSIRRRNGLVRVGFSSAIQGFGVVRASDRLILDYWLINIALLTERDFRMQKNEVNRASESQAGRYPRKLVQCKSLRGIKRSFPSTTKRCSLKEISSAAAHSIMVRSAPPSSKGQIYLRMDS